jgi:hypothetical protein
MRKLILGAALAWGLAALVHETGRALAGYDARAESREEVDWWRPGMPRLAELDRCLALVRRRVPPGRVVAFASPADTPETPDHEFYTWRWAAYLLPRWEVAPLDDPQVGDVAGYLLTWRREIANPRLEPLAADREIPACRLYRVRWVRKAGP